MDSGQAPDEKTVRYLKALVTVLTTTMIIGVVTIVTLLVMRFTEVDRISLPDSIELPEGVGALAFTQGEGWFAVVTDRDEILIFSRLTGTLEQRVAIEIAQD